MVLWQPKAWCDRPIAVEWAKLVFKKVIKADIAAGVCDSEDTYLLIQDNLDAQKLQVEKYAPQLVRHLTHSTSKNNDGIRK